jgi:signal peptidase I
MSLPGVPAPSGPTPGVPPGQPRQGRGDRIAGWLIVPLLAIFIVAYLTFVVFFDVARVDGPSMLPTLRGDDRVLVTKGYTTPHRGEIVVFTEPAMGGGTDDIIKRVVGVPGDAVEIDRGRAIVDGAPEPPHTGVFTGQQSIAAITVPKGTIYVMGDNRPESYDSRERGPIPMSQVRGRAVVVVWPLARMRVLP